MKVVEVAAFVFVGVLVSYAIAGAGKDIAGAGKDIRYGLNGVAGAIDRCRK